MKNIVAALTIVGITVAQGFTNQVRADKVPIAIAVKVQGEVNMITLTDEDVWRYESILIDHKLYHGDLVKIEKGANLVIKCNNNSQTWTIAEGIWGVNNNCGDKTNPFGEGLEPFATELKSPETDALPTVE
ncbi:MAG: hypothetical protein F6J98_14765 [Moorea sp. SIO4G2]|uniref:Uncharacterized protein n=1 Tax=Moorena bouillonii PNG TaxID=568701 RepID=A0A1U7MXB6_9CYAN|nr:MULTISPECIES: hypothetical protein [Moorena]NEO61626.1 hypothetical protein [Moorena sp. SIO4G2]NEP28827.1 hypothetical protein [Moorena sp. SIO3I6]OLT58329.1 hypothetical protein BJP37_03990 [Moorena bouillonii PNG]